MFTEMIHGYPVHPVASMFPMSDDETLKALADDIKKNGQMEPIVLGEYWDDPYEVLRSHGIEVEDGADIGGVDFGDEVNTALTTPHLVLLDGRNRLTACGLAGVEPEFTTGIPGDAMARTSESDDWEVYVSNWIVSKNLHRRHLSTGQRAAVAAKWVEYFAVEAKKRQAEAGKTFGRGGAIKLPAKLPEANQGEARDKAAEMFNVSPRSVSNAKKLMNESPDDFKRVEAGEVAPSRALKEIKAKARPQPPTAAELQAAREQLIQREADKLLKKFNSEEITLLLHYIHTGKKDHA